MVNLVEKRVEKKYVVYTALFGDYDELNEFNFESPECDFICYTDNVNLKSDSWMIIVVDCELNPNMMNRYYKILPHKHLSKYDASLYVDANIRFKQDPAHLFEKYLLNYDVLALKHNKRDCIYSEGLACIKLCKVEFLSVTNQVRGYINDGFPKNHGLTLNRVLLRAHNEQHIVTLMEDWWVELNTKTQRDQLSFCYVTWKNKTKVGYISENPESCNEYFELLPHEKEKVNTLIKGYRHAITVIRLIIFSPIYFYRVTRLL